MKRYPLAFLVLLKPEKNVNIYHLLLHYRCVLAVSKERAAEFKS